MCKIMFYLQAKGGTISPAIKHVFEKSVAKTVTRKVPSPEILDITGFSATSKPKETTPTRL